MTELKLDLTIQVRRLQAASRSSMAPTIPPYNPKKPKNEGETKRAVLFGELKNWTWSRESPVHFICHSQGGNTVRMLIEIMSGNHADIFPGDFRPKDRRNW